MTRKTNCKYALSKRIDALINRFITKDFRRRQSLDKYGYVTDGCLQTFLENQEKYRDLDKRISLQDLKNRTFSLYFECLRDFLKSQDIAILGQKMDRAIGTFKGKLVMIDYVASVNRSLTWLYIVTPNIEEDTTIRYVMTRVEPWIEDKIEHIADFVVDKNANEPLLEAAKTVRKKTREERIHRDVNGEEYVEFDMYGITQHYGTSIGLSLYYAERNIRIDFRLEEQKK